MCWVLKKLFEMPGAHPMAFKGGTSLSKVWGAIHRFSEDIDITVDYRSFGTDFDHAAALPSGNKIDRITATLRAELATYVRQTVLPYFEGRVANELGDKRITLRIEGDEKLFLEYTSVVTGDSYIRDSVQLEFGGRNTLAPHDRHQVQPYLADCAFAAPLEFPVAFNVVTVSVERTFWEKVTLIHAHCMQEKDFHDAKRLSRHWYDLCMLVKHGHVDLEKMLVNDELLREVLLLKKVFYRSAGAQYDCCISGELKMLPEGELLEGLRNDYSNMGAMDRDDAHVPSIDEIEERVKFIEKSVNQRYAGYGEQD